MGSREAEACYRAACPRCKAGDSPGLTGPDWWHGYEESETHGPERCAATDFRAAVAALPPEPDRDAASASYERPLWVESRIAPREGRLLQAIHARCYAWRPDGSGPLPPEQTPRGNRFATIAAACEMALAGEEVQW